MLLSRGLGQFVGQIEHGAASIMSLSRRGRERETSKGPGYGGEQFLNWIKISFKFAFK